MHEKFFIVKPKKISDLPLSKPETFFIPLKLFTLKAALRRNVDNRTGSRSPCGVSHWRRLSTEYALWLLCAVMNCAACIRIVSVT